MYEIGNCIVCYTNDGRNVKCNRCGVLCLLCLWVTTEEEYLDERLIRYLKFMMRKTDNPVLECEWCDKRCKSYILGPMCDAHK